MKTRIIKDGNICWFGSVGKNEDGSGKFINKDKSSYADKEEGVANSLNQRLRIIKGELWYNISLGIPLLEKQRSRGIIDSYIISTALDHPDVISIVEFDSYIEKNHIYKCFLKCSTKYGDVNISI